MQGLGELAVAVVFAGALRLDQDQDHVFAFEVCSMTTYAKLHMEPVSA